MAYTLPEFMIRYESRREENQKELSRLNDLEVNGSDEYYRLFGEEIKRRGIGVSVNRGLRGHSPL